MVIYKEVSKGKNKSKKGYRGEMKQKSERREIGEEDREDDGGKRS